MINLKPSHCTAFTAIALSACSTTTIADLQAKPPREIYRTNKPVDVVTTCLIETLGRLGAPTVYKRSDGTTVLNFTIENDSTAIFTFVNGTVEVRTISRIVPFRAKTATCV